MNRVEPWEVWQLPGGCLLYLHSRFGRLPDAEGVHETKPAGATMMPFGKYRGAPVGVVVDHVPYCEWLLEQSWFAEKFPQHRKYLAEALHTRRNDGEGPSAA